MTPAACKSPVDLMRLAGVEPPSPAIETILSAIYAQRPTKEQARQWRKLTPGLLGKPWPKEKPRRVGALIGRRGLKTSGIIAWSCVYEAIFGRHEEHAAPGSRIYGVIIAPRQRQAREAVRGVRGVLDSLAGLGVAYEERDANGIPEIVITGPSARCERVITIMTCDAVAVRSTAVFFLAADEAAFWPSEEWLLQKDEDVVRAIRGAMLQFPGALEIFASSPGKPGSYFHRLVTKPTSGTVVVTASSWVANPRITRERCWADAEGVREVFEQEYEATRWGAGGGAFLDSGAVWATLGSEYADKGPRAGSFVVGYDQGQLRDAASIVVTSSFEVEVNPVTAPVRNVVVEHAEAIPSSKKNPLPTATLVARVVAVSRAFGGAPIVFDQFCAVDVKTELRKLGYREHEDLDKVPTRKTFMQVGMAPHQQTPRWMLLKALVNGRRLHLGRDAEPLAKELSGLTATQLSSGSLKVEGRVDNQADALAITLPIVVRLAPTDGPANGAKLETTVRFDPGEGLEITNRWWLQMPNGSRVPSDPPRWHPSFERWAREMIAEGVRTPSILQWEREREEKTTKRTTIPVDSF